MRSGRSILLLGGRGYIGSRVAPALTKVFDSVVIASRKPFTARRSQATDHGGEIGQGDLCEITYDGTLNGLVNLVLDMRPNLVINFLATGVQPQDRNTRHLAEINSIWPAHIYEAALRAASTRFIQIGSMAEYRPPDTSRRLIESDATTLENPYGASKAAATSILSVLASSHCPVIVLRLFGVFGPREPAHRLTTQMVTALREGRQVDLSDGAQIRDFVFIDDVVAALESAVRYSSITPFSVFNIGTGHGVSVRTFAERLVSIGGYKSGLLNFGVRPQRDTDAPYLVADANRAARTLNWKARWSLDEALRVVTAPDSLCSTV